MGEWVGHRPQIAELAHARGDRAFIEKFVDVPRHLSSWTQDIGYLEGKRVLDFGCGCGEAAVGTAVFHNPEFVLGVDCVAPPADLAERIGRFTDVEDVPSNVRFEQTSLANGLAEGEFDFIYSWSFLLHVSPKLLPTLVSRLYDRLTLGGRVLIQLSPLYHSANGAQLGEFGIGPWEHLVLPVAELRARVLDSRRGQDDARSAAWNSYENLNRIGAADISKLFRESGFHQVRSYETCNSLSPPETLCDRYCEDALSREQVVFLFAKA